LIAAMLLALDGYYIGYAHMLQYQSILFLMTPLVVLLLYRLPHPLASSPERLLLLRLRLLPLPEFLFPAGPHGCAEVWMLHAQILPPRFV